MELKSGFRFQNLVEPQPKLFPTFGNLTVHSPGTEALMLLFQFRNNHINMGITNNMASSGVNGHPEEVYDVLIVGGGPAGLSAATSLARSLHTVVIFDSKQYRNARLPHLHGAPGWDHEDPASIRTKMQKDLIARYNTTKLLEHGASRAAQCEEGRARFVVTDEKGMEWFGRKLVIATGVSDILPNLPGYDMCWVNGMYMTAISFMTTSNLS